MKRSQQQTQTQSASHVPVGSATKSRRGFTLVELLVVIAIIGVLVGMLAVGIGPVLTRVHEGAVTAEMGQIELAIESFKNKHGFYPPNFNANGGINAAADMLPYLNKLSPNHRENTNFPGTTTNRLQTWWNAIGQHLDNRSSLVFWLTGLSPNKQFPITGGLAERDGGFQLPAIYGSSEVITVDSVGSLLYNPPKPKKKTRLAVDGNGVEIEIPRASFLTLRVASFLKSRWTL